MKNITVALSFLVLMFVTLSCNAQNPIVKDTVEPKVQMSKDITESRFKVGQMWSYKTRPNEKNSFFIVVKVDVNRKLGNIIHIAVQNLKMKNPNSHTGFSDRANHLPFAEVAINESAVKLLKKKVDLPDYEEGYNLWKEAFDNKRAGVYTITLAKAVDIMEAALNQ